jgi:hypothetical protein
LDLRSHLPQAVARPKPHHAPQIRYPAGTLLYLDQPQWSQADGPRKVAIAADFMRVFCGDPGMPALDLVDCLDHGADTEPLFERALSCVARRPR